MISLYLPDVLGTGLTRLGAGAGWLFVRRNFDLSKSAERGIYLDVMNCNSTMIGYLSLHLPGVVGTGLGLLARRAG